MARLSKHGREIGRIDGLVRIRAYFENGEILKNEGHGWKLYGKIKPGINPREVFAKHKANHEQKIKDNPAAAEYRRLLHSLAGISKRWKLNLAVKLMPDDPDGVWSEVCDGYADNVSASVDEIAELCRAYKAAHMTA